MFPKHSTKHANTDAQEIEGLEAELLNDSETSVSPASFDNTPGRSTELHRYMQMSDILV